MRNKNNLGLKLNKIWRIKRKTVKKTKKMFRKIRNNKVRIKLKKNLRALKRINEILIKVEMRLRKIKRLLFNNWLLLVINKFR